MAVAASVATVHYWQLGRPSRPKLNFQKIDISREHCTIYLRDRALVGNLAEFDDGFFAYLMFDYYRSRSVLANQHLMLISDGEAPSTIYRILVRLPDDLIAGVDLLAHCKDHRLTSRVDYDWITHQQLAENFHQTTVFMEAYSGPVSQKLERLYGGELEGYLRRFIRFKSMTDPRIYRNITPVPSPLTRKEARRLAADMIAVAKFYNLPLSLLIGIGAMENNFMNVQGDLHNTKWKRHLQPGDVVLERRGSRVLVKNDSSGVWQITRESLRYAHRLFLSDKRDYSQLRVRLRPPEHLDMGDLSQDVLTTYAGILLRDLLDHFRGNVTLAAGAYNGTVTNPNAHYAAGVEMVAKYARRVINRAVELNNRAITTTSVNQSALNQPQ